MLLMVNQRPLIFSLNTMNVNNRTKGKVQNKSKSTVVQIFMYCVILNLLFVFIEVVVGVYYNSVGLLSDAGHNLSDVFSLLLVLLAFRIAQSDRSEHFTYGYKKGTILISLVNTLILFVAVGVIIIESIYRLKNPMPVSGAVISWTACVGILVNGITTLLLMRGRKSDLNMRGAFLHMLTDTLVSVGVVCSGIIISIKNWLWIDPVISIVIALVILFSTTKLLKDSLCLSLDGVPNSINMSEIKGMLDTTPSISGWHHLHVWAISTSEIAATFHVVLKDLQQITEVKNDLKRRLKEKGINHCTIECDSSEEKDSVNF